MRRERHPRSGQRGAVLVEVAITFPLFLTVVFAVIELGMLYRADLMLASASRDGARTGAVMGDDPTADFEILRRMKTTTGTTHRNRITRIVVFRATSPHDAVPPSCLQTPVPAGPLCNVYDASDFDSPVASFGCDPGEKDGRWCPRTRNVRQSGPPDMLGVYMEAEHRTMTGLFQLTHRISDTYVLRLEPTNL